MTKQNTLSYKKKGSLGVHQKNTLLQKKGGNAAEGGYGLQRRPGRKGRWEGGYRYVEVQLNLSELQLSEIRLAFTEVLAFSLKFLRYLIRAFSFHPAAFN